MAAPPEKPKSPVRLQRPDAAEAKRRFATAIARAELGKHYWNARSEQALQEAMKKKPKR
ncbi:hypothetical protein BH10PSE9_BH10PSE9_03370 [soil metagenome]